MSWGSFFKHLGKGSVIVATHIVPIIGTIEQVAESIPGLKGDKKKEAALAILKTTLPLTEELAGVDLNDADLAAALSACIDAGVAFKNAQEKLDAVIHAKKAA